MAITINQVDSGQNSATRAESNKTEGSPHQSATNTPGVDKSEAVETLTITPEASRLLQLEQEMSAASPIDSERVDSIRRQLDAGAYVIDSDTIAQRLIASEQEAF